MAARLLWKPYMKSHTLAGLLPGVDIETLIVWGREDAIIPLSAANAFKTGIKGSRLEILDGCGHMPEMEKPEEFSKLVLDFLD
jgi:pimeloyl-ACP methyl ester carboxylesterase